MDRHARPIFFDNAHLTPYGVHHIADMLIAKNWYFDHPDTARSVGQAGTKKTR
jgi:hypothetical protein